MASRPPSNSAGGAPIALGALGGAGLGFAAGQPTIGFLVGIAIGIAVAAWIWRRGR